MWVCERLPLKIKIISLKSFEKPIATLINQFFNDDVANSH